MKLRNLLSLALLVPMAATLIAADAPDGCYFVRGEATEDTADDVFACRQDNWIHRATGPVGNLGDVGPETYPSWDTTPPGAFEEGNGGGALGSSVTDIALGGDPAHGAHIEGTYTGVLDNLAITMHAMMVAPTAFNSHGFSFVLEIDGRTVWNGIGQDAWQVGTNNTTTDGITSFRFSVGDLYQVLEWEGLANEADTEHTISFTMSPFFFGDDGAYVWDAAEVPSSVFFNLAPLDRAIYTPFAIA